MIKTGHRIKDARGKVFFWIQTVFIWMLISFFLFFQGCSVPSQREDKVSFEAPLIWPSPPGFARIAYERSIEKPEDIKARKGILQRIAKLLFGQSLIRIIKPYGVVIDGSGRMIVADTALRCVHIFDVAKEKYSCFDKANKKKLASPVGVAVDGDDNIYVSDSVKGKIFVFNRSGKYLFDIEERLQRPVGIAINKDKDLLYVVNTWGHNVTVYNTEGKFLFSFGERGAEEGEFNFPTNIFIDKKGYVYITDTLNYRVQVLDNNGNFLKMFGRHGDGSGNFSRPKGVAVDKKGHIYVVDSLFDNIQIFDREGRFLLNFGSTGQGKGRFWLPSGIFIDPDDRIYVADSYNRRVQIFSYIGTDIEVIGNEE